METNKEDYSKNSLQSQPRGKIGVHIIVSAECREKLKSIKIYPRETFGDIIERLIQVHEKKVLPEPQEEEITLSPEEEQYTKAEATTTDSGGFSQ